MINMVVMKTVVDFDDDDADIGDDDDDGRDDDRGMIS